MENPQTPIQRHRRAERYQQQDAAPYAPSPATEFAPAPAYQRTPRSARNAAPVTAEASATRLAPPPLFTQEDAPPAMARPKRPAPTPEKRRKAGYRMPWWITACIVGLMFVSLALLAAQNMMQAYLTQRQQEREAAYQAVVDAHPMYYTDLIARYAEEYNLRPAFVTAIILNESSFRTDAESNVGARGLMQLMPDTAEWIAGKLDMDYFHFDFMYDAEMNIRFGTWYLGYLSRLFRGDPVSVASAYHAGQGTVTRWLSDESKTRDGVSLNLDSLSDGPTKTYAGRVTQAYAIYEALYYPQPDGDDGGHAAHPDGAAS